MTTIAMDFVGLPSQDTGPEFPSSCTQEEKHLHDLHHQQRQHPFNGLVTFSPSDQIDGLDGPSSSYQSQSQTYSQHQQDGIPRLKDGAERQVKINQYPHPSIPLASRNLSQQPLFERAGGEQEILNGLGKPYEPRSNDDQGLTKDQSNHNLSINRSSINSTYQIPSSSLSNHQSGSPAMREPSEDWEPEDITIKGLSVSQTLDAQLDVPEGYQGKYIDQVDGRGQNGNGHTDGMMGSAGRATQGHSDAVTNGEQRVIDSQFYPESVPQINPFHRLSYPYLTDPSEPRPSSAQDYSPGDTIQNERTFARLHDFARSRQNFPVRVSGTDRLTGEEEERMVPIVHVKRVGRRSVELVAHQRGMNGDIVSSHDASFATEKRNRSRSGKKGGNDESGLSSTLDPHGKKKGLIGRVFGRNQSTPDDDDDLASRGGDEERPEFRPSGMNEMGLVTDGPAPPSPPTSVAGDDSSDDSSSDDDRPVRRDDQRLGPPNQVDLARNRSISGQSFTEEPESLPTDGTVESKREGNGRDRSWDSNPGQTHSGTQSTSATDRSSFDRARSGMGGYANLPIPSRTGPIRAGSIAASKGRTAGSGGALTASSSLNNGINNNVNGNPTRVIPPSPRQVEMSLDQREPAIPSAAEQAPIVTGSIPVPPSSAGLPQPPGTVGIVPQGAGGSYFPQPANGQQASYVEGGLQQQNQNQNQNQNWLHPSSASFMSTASAGSSSQQHAGPSYKPERRNTSGSLQLPNNLGQPATRSPLIKAHTQLAVSGWDGPSLASMRSISQTEVPGLQGSALDTDILAEAEKLRRQRLSKRARKRSNSDDTATVLGGSPEPPFAREMGASRAQTASPPIGGDLDGFSSNNQTQNPAQAVAPTVLPAAPKNDADGPFVGNLIGEDHVNYVLMYNMLTGIRIGVSRCQAKMKRPLAAEDFTAKHKYSFDIVGNELTPSARYDFKFKDYAPWVFRELREDYFHLDPADYLLSLTAKYILSELGSPGKSGSFFYFSRDYRFIIKTIHHAEHKYLRSILKDYYEHIKNNPHTLMSRFYGLHRVKLPRGRKIHFVIMNNLFPPHRDIHETYDLKGSAIGREYPEEKAKINPKATMKDLNWLHRGRMFELGPEKRALFGEQVKRDRDFLKRIGVMDYSLLIGIHNMERGNRDNIRENQLSVFQPKVDTMVRRKPSSVKGNSDAAAMRKAVRRSDPKALTSAVAELPTSDSADRRHFLFYQDEGGLRATDEANEAMDIIYYLGVIDILTPYNMTKKLEHLWRSLTEKDRHMVSCVPPDEYGDRFLAFLVSFFRDSDPSKRPRMELKPKTE